MLVRILSSGIRKKLRSAIKKLRSAIRLEAATEISEVTFISRILEPKYCSSGVMIDVGAHVGGSLEPFARYGWRVHAFEPDRENRKKLEQKCSQRNFKRVSIDPRAVSNRVESNVTFYASGVSTGISGLSAFHPSHRAVDSVETVTLDVYCDQNGVNTVDFLKIDTEGYDLFVLQGFPWDRIMPKIILCEFEDSKTIPLGYNFHDLASYLLQYRYHVLISEWRPIVRYGGPHVWRRFAPYPGDLIDQQAWGNLIAVSQKVDFARLQWMCRWFEYKSKLGNALRRFGARL